MSFFVATVTIYSGAARNHFCGYSWPYWWLIELPYWFKAGLWLKDIELLTTRDAKDNFVTS